MSADASTGPPLFAIRGDASPEEVAAIVAVLAAVGGSAPATEKPPRSEWASPARRMRTPLPHGPGAWRASALGR